MRRHEGEHYQWAPCRNPEKFPMSMQIKTTKEGTEAGLPGTWSNNFPCLIVFPIIRHQTLHRRHNPFSSFDVCVRLRLLIKSNNFSVFSTARTNKAKALKCTKHVGSFSCVYELVRSESWNAFFISLSSELLSFEILSSAKAREVLKCENYQVESCLIKQLKTVMANYRGQVLIKSLKLFAVSRKSIPMFVQIFYIYKSFRKKLKGLTKTSIKIQEFYELKALFFSSPVLIQLAKCTRPLTGCAQISSTSFGIFLITIIEKLPFDVLETF